MAVSALHRISHLITKTSQQGTSDYYTIFTDEVEFQRNYNLFKI